LKTEFFLEIQDFNQKMQKSLDFRTEPLTEAKNIIIWMEINMKPKISEPPSFVPEEKAKEHALYTLRTFWASSTRGLESWDNAQIESEPLLINDLNGQLLFYEYVVTDGKQPLGLIKASASKIIGSAVPQIQMTPRGWDPHFAIEKAKERTTEYLPKAKIASAGFVCYSYPKIGVSIKISDPNVGEGTLIFDIGSFDLVESINAFGLDGITSWSFYNNVAIPKAEEREKRWNALDKEMTLLKESVRGLGDESNINSERAALQKNIMETYLDLIMKEEGVLKPLSLEKDLKTDSWKVRLIELITQKIIQYRPPPCKTHDCYAGYSQQKNDYCAVATGQMILDFYRYYYSQDQIAPSMGYVPGNGCSQDGQIAGYKSLSNNGLTASYDNNPTWDKAAAEIDANRPLKSGISGHARACFGYKAANYWPINRPRPTWLFILDPWPPSNDFCKANIVWEDWYAITHTNFIYIRHS
jgi:hypothetical protein